MRINFIKFLVNKLYHNRYKLFTVGLGLIFSSVLFIGQTVFAQTNATLIAPTILSPKPSEFVTSRQSVFAGVTYNNTLVDVYVDGVLNGRAKVKNSNSGVASWTYKTTGDLALGDHIVSTIARSEAEVLRSPESAKIYFRVENPFPAPTILAPMVDSRTTYTKPWIAGVAKNNSTVDVFIDGRLDGTLQATNSPTGTANFEYQPSNNLALGWHAATTQAKDPRGKTSKFSAALVFEIKSKLNEVTPTTALIQGIPHPQPTKVIAPTLLEPKTGIVTTKNKPLISGVSRDSQTIEVFIDGHLNGKINQPAKSSEIFSFAYKPYLALKPGIHMAAVRAVDRNGDKSSLSNTQAFLVRPKDNHLIVSPVGTKNIRLAKTGVKKVAAASKINPILLNKKTAPDKTTAGLQLEQTTATDNEPENTESEIKVVGAPTTTSADTTENNNKTTLVVLLAIAAIIIIGLISWYTSREETEPEENLFSKPDKSVEPESEAQIWNEESTDTNPPDYLMENTALENTGKDDDMPPPPPPPALGI